LPAEINEQFVTPYYDWKRPQVGSCRTIGYNTAVVIFTSMSGALQHVAYNIHFGAHMRAFEPYRRVVFIAEPVNANGKQEVFISYDHKGRVAALISQLKLLFLYNEPVLLKRSADVLSRGARSENSRRKQRCR